MVEPCGGLPSRRTASSGVTSDFTAVCMSVCLSVATTSILLPAFSKQCTREGSECLVERFGPFVSQIELFVRRL